MKNPALWIALTRPDNLVLALAAAGVGRERFSACHLLYEDSPWWRRVRWDEYKELFASVTTIGKIRSGRGLSDLPRFYRQLAARQERLRALRIAPGDVIFTLAGITALSNALASAYPDVFKVFAMPLKKYVDASLPADFWRYRHTTSSWLQNHFLEPLAGLHRTLHLKPWRSNGGDGVRVERLERPLETVFQAILILSNTGRELPPNPGPQLRAAPFPDLAELAGLLPLPVRPVPAQPRVIFFGTPFLLVRNLPPEQYSQRLNEWLDFLRFHYADRCQLVYRPHPAEKGERDHLRLDQFVYENDQEVAELYFLKHATDIGAVFSVSSTVSRVAYNYGLNAYALWRGFPFEPSAAAYFETLMGTVPTEFDLSSTETPPIPYADGRRSGMGRTFTGALAHVLSVV